MNSKNKKILVPNHWKILLFLDKQKFLLDVSSKYDINFCYKIKDKYSINELSRELFMQPENVRRYIRELEDLGELVTMKNKNKKLVIL
ncbi:MAG: hypothetical protein KC550_02735 [Nanoarchaeota archaeon]|nr:hypothetical protein [Nanoarchaeota archaeon]